MLLNLLDNAAKFTDRGQITLGAEHRDAHLYLYVQDTGCGIAPAALAEIRLGLAAGDETGAVVRAHGTSAWASTSPGTWSCGTAVSFKSRVSWDAGPPVTSTCPCILVNKPGPPGRTMALSAVGAPQIRASSALVKKAYEFVAANYVTGFTRADLAARLGVSEAYISRAFRRVTGMALWDYVNHYRVARACELLDRTALSITEVALAVGFNDPAYFSRVFRKETGHSPQSYRTGAALRT